MRKCGDCQLCCKLVPVKDLEKKAGEKCRHAKFKKGCSIYSKRPFHCKLWSCRWLFDPLAGNLPRPDHSHVVIDCVPDFVLLTDNETKEEQKIPVLQVWCDPKFPDAHRAPAVRAFLAAYGERGYAAMIRYNATDGFALFPPAMNSDGQWHAKFGNSTGRENTAGEIMDVLGERGVDKYLDDLLAPASRI